MPSAASRSKLSRHWGPVAAAGGLGFAVGVGGLALLGRDWLRTRAGSGVRAGRRARCRRDTGVRRHEPCGCHNHHAGARPVSLDPLRAQRHDARPVHVRQRRASRALQRTLHRNVRPAARTRAAQHAVAPAAGGAHRSGHIRRRSRCLRGGVPQAGRRGPHRDENRGDQGRPHRLAGERTDVGRRLAGDAYRRDGPIVGRKGTRRAAPAGRTAQRHRRGDLVVPRARRKHAQ